MINNVPAAQDGIDRLEMLSETKLLDYHPGKSGFTLIDDKKEIKKLEEELETAPLMLYV